jgi:hypothetical protein
MSSRSNSASAAKIAKTSLPAGVVVSIAAPWPVRTFSPTPRVVRSWTGVDEVVEVAAEPVELPDDERVAVAQRLEAGGETGTIVAIPGGAVVVELDCVDAGGEQRIALQVGGLGSVCFGHSHVADQHPILLVTHKSDYVTANNPAPRTLRPVT